MAKNSDLERGFLARTFVERGNEKISKLYVDAKSMGANIEWFSDPPCRLIWMAAEELFSEPGFDDISFFKIHSRANAISKRTKDRDLQGIVVNRQFYEGIEKVVRGVDEMGTYCRMLENACIERKTKDLFAKIDESFRSGMDAKTAVAQLVNEAQGLILDKQNERTVSISKTIKHIDDQYQDVYQHVYVNNEKGYAPGLPLPWDCLAKKLNGFGKVLTVVAARPGVGKTSFAIALMRYWLDCGVRVVFNSLDMSATELMKRQLAEASQVSTRSMQFAECSEAIWQKNYEAVKKAEEKFIELEKTETFRIFEEPDVDVLAAEVKILADQRKIDVLVVDYVQLMKTRGPRGRNKKDEVSYVSNTLHRISNELQIPVLALSQINRDSSKEGEEPQLHNIKDSGDIEQDASNVIILHPHKQLYEKWIDANKPEQWPKQYYLSDFSSPVGTLMPMWVIVAKARDGEGGSRVPFLNVLNRYSWYQGDYKNTDKDAKFAKVYASWKHEDMESVWDSNGALLDYNSDLLAFNAKRMAEYREQQELERERIIQKCKAEAEAKHTHQDELQMSEQEQVPDEHAEIESSKKQERMLGSGNDASLPTLEAVIAEAQKAESETQGETVVEKPSDGTEKSTEQNERDSDAEEEYVEEWDSQAAFSDEDSDEGVEDVDEYESEDAIEEQTLPQEEEAVADEASEQENGQSDAPQEIVDDDGRRPDVPF